MVETTLKGKLKMAVVSKASQSEARRGKEYWYAPLQILEKSSGEVQSEEIMLIFWKENFPNEKTQQDIANLKENQVIEVRGNVGGRDNGLLDVVELVEIESDDSDFII